MRTQAVRDEVQKLLRQVPFQPFILIMENGERITIGHPENIAFDPGTDGTDSGSPDFYVISGRLMMFDTFEAVTNMALLDPRAESS